MEPFIKTYAELGGPREARAHLSAAPHHFLLTDDYLPEGFPSELTGRVVKRGPNRRVDYLHVPSGAGNAFIRALCAMVMEEPREREEISLGQFLQGFLGQLKDMVDLREVAGNITQKVSELFEAEGAAILVFDEHHKELRFLAAHNQTSDLEEKLRRIRIPLGRGVAGWVAEHKKPQLVNRADQDPRFFGDVDASTDFITRDLLAAPILLGDKLIGVVEVVNRKKQPFCEYDLPTLSVFASVVAIFLEKAQLLAERKRHLQAMDKAEIANSVLHNIGNVLSSLLVSCTNIAGKLDNTLHAKLEKTGALLEEHADDPASFFTDDPRGAMVVPFLTELAARLAEERAEVRDEVAKIEDKTHLMRDIIETQQTIARIGSAEAQDLIQIIEEALSVLADRLAGNHVTVVRDFHGDRPIRGQKTKLVHLFINLVKNGGEAMLHLPADARRLRIETRDHADGTLRVSIQDQGYGIKEEHRDRLFSHGFTTKEDGHGFGLDFCAKTMQEMGGTIEAVSEGTGRGATFVLTFPPFEEDPSEPEEKT